jgi:hypothetical protein
MYGHLRLGSVVGVAIGPVMHVGIVSYPSIFGSNVISSSPRTRQVTEETLFEFANGGRVMDLGYPGQLAPHVVIERARRKLGEPWNLFTANCEHLVSWAHGLEVTSPQLRNAIFWLVLVAGISCLAAKAL